MKPVHIGEVGQPKDVRPRRLELAVDVIQRTWRSRVADRGPDGFAADNPSQTHVPHQSRHRATGNIDALALELSPDLAHAINHDIAYRRDGFPVKVTGSKPRRASDVRC